MTRRTVEITCDNCGTIAVKRKDHVGRSAHNFCSRTCAAEHGRKIRKSASVSATHKTCSKCNEFKSLDEFHKGNWAFGRRNECKDCRKGQVPKDVNRHNNLMKKYGISLEDYERMYDSQNGKCAACGDHHSLLVVDHNHDNGDIRDLLCHPCNKALGFVREDIFVLSSLIGYLEKHNACSQD